MKNYDRMDNLPPGLPKKLLDLLDRAGRVLYFGEVLHYFRDTLYPKLQELMLSQYPFMQGHTHPIFKEYCTDIHNCVAYDMYCFAMHTEEDMRLKINLREKYTYFEEIKKFYGSPEKAKLITHDDREIYRSYNDAEFEKMMQEENIEIERIHNFRQERMKQFYDIVQPVLFETCPWLMNMDPDSWIIYARYIRDAYHIWENESFRVEEILRFGLPYEYINKGYRHYMEELALKYSEEDAAGLEYPLR